MHRVFSNFQLSGLRSVLNGVLKECSPYWNAIKSVRHFLKTPCCDLILPHFTILYCGFCPIMLPSKKKKRKCSIKVICRPADLNDKLRISLREVVTASQQNQSSQTTFAVFAQYKLYYHNRSEGGGSKKPNDPSSKFHLLRTIQATTILWSGLNLRISTQQN